MRGTMPRGSFGADPPIQFDYLTRRASFEELVELAHLVYGEHPRSTSTAEALWRAFPRGYVGAWVEGKLRGCIQLWPLDRRRVNDFLLGRRSERDLTADDLVTVTNSPRTVWYFSGLLMAPAWRGRGMAVHLLAESMVRWHRDLTWRPPIRFTALAASKEGMRFVEEFGMKLVIPAGDTADGHALYARRFDDESQLPEVVRSAREAADRKGRLVAEPGGEGPGTGAGP